MLVSVRHRRMLRSRELWAIYDIRLTADKGRQELDLVLKNITNTKMLVEEKAKIVAARQVRIAAEEKELKVQADIAQAELDEALPALEMAEQIRVIEVRVLAILSNTSEKRGVKPQHEIEQNSFLPREFCPPHYYGCQKSGRQLSQDECRSTLPLKRDAALMTSWGSGRRILSKLLGSCSLRMRVEDLCRFLDAQLCSKLRVEPCCRLGEERESRVFCRPGRARKPLRLASSKALGDLDKKALSEIKSYARPPVEVEKVMESVMILLGHDPNWAEAKRQLGDSDFVNKCDPGGKDQECLILLLLWLPNCRQPSDKEHDSGSHPPILHPNPVSPTKHVITFNSSLQQSPNVASTRSMFISFQNVLYSHLPLAASFHITASVTTTAAATTTLGSRFSGVTALHMTDTLVIWVWATKLCSRNPYFKACSSACNRPASVAQVHHTELISYKYHVGDKLCPGDRPYDSRINHHNLNTILTSSSSAGDDWHLSALNIEVLRAEEVKRRRVCSSARMKVWRKWEITEKTSHQPATSSSTAEICSQPKPPGSGATSLPALLRPTTVTAAYPSAHQVPVPAPASHHQCRRRVSSLYRLYVAQEVASTPRTHADVDAVGKKNGCMEKMVHICTLIFLCPTLLQAALACPWLNIVKLPESVDFQSPTARKDWEIFEGYFENYLIATGQDECPDKVKLAPLKNMLSSQGHALFETCDISPEDSMLFTHEQCIALDLMGPYPRSARDQRFVLVVTYLFTPWYELYTLPSSHTHHIAATLEKEFFPHWGYLRTILSDDATQFSGSRLRDLCMKWHVIKHTTDIHHIRANPTERRNQAVEAQLRLRVGKDHTTWSQHIPEIAFRLRNRTNEATGKLPAEMLYGAGLAKLGEFMCRPPDLNPGADDSKAGDGDYLNPCNPVTTSTYVRTTYPPWAAPVLLDDLRGERPTPATNGKQQQQLQRDGSHCSARPTCSSVYHCPARKQQPHRWLPPYLRHRTHATQDVNGPHHASCMGLTAGPMSGAPANMPDAQRS
ncbi:hypothetical protein PR048_001124 [Dryococelus australis]|uniref:Integrase catalytic domain-containing protein n=1 Tax=Dryococelus australis TaxID=614101 RepID=A0ABQ9IGK8_9NEOP|nr:hypothetical protein PR048_001124 [Dryococelus australis]